MLRVIGIIAVLSSGIAHAALLECGAIVSSFYSPIGQQGAELIVALTAKDLRSEGLILEVHRYPGKSNGERGEIEKLVSYYPSFASKIGFGVDKAKGVSFQPDWKVLNDRIQKLRAKGRKVPFDFEPVQNAHFARLSDEEFARMSLRGKVPASLFGAELFHDVRVHWTYLLYPQVMADHEMAKVRSLYEIVDDPLFTDLQFQSSLHDMIYRITSGSWDFTTAVDFTNAVFNRRPIARQHRVRASCGGG